MAEDERAICEKALECIRDGEREICKAVLNRIYKEKHNFEHIVEQRPFNNTGHEQAVTVTSFKKLGEAANYLCGVLEFHVDAMILSSLADQRDATRILAFLEKLEPRIKMRT